MANTNPEPGDMRFRASENSELDRALDAALAKYAAVEPRAGLEERVLAGLRSSQAEAPHRTWWRWGLASAVAAMLVAALFLGWRANKPLPRQIANHPSAKKPTSAHEPSPIAPQAPVMAENRPPTAQPAVTPTRSAHPDSMTAGSTTAGSTTARSTAARSTTAHSAAAGAAVAKANPKLDAFPSRRPLSKQELALARYVRDFPEQAIIVAQAQAELDAEIQKEMQADPSDSEQQER
jgi:hypothetical protein